MFTITKRSILGMMPITRRELNELAPGVRLQARLERVLSGLIRKGIIQSGSVSRDGVPDTSYKLA